MGKMNLKWMSSKLWFFCFWGLIIIIIVFNRLNSSPENAASVQVKPTNEKARSGYQEISKKDYQDLNITLSSKQLVSEYSANEFKADKKYKDKIFTITGTIRSIRKIGSHGFVTLEGIEKIIGSDTVTFMFGSEYYNKLAELKENDVVSLKGRCLGKGDNPSFDIDISFIAE